MSDDRIEVLEGLRGCGGAGFSVAFKWRAVRDAAAGPAGKIVIANADEGEPGTFKDGWVLLEHTEEFVRGMMLAAELVGAERGFVYLRPEYRRHRDVLQSTLLRMVEEGWLSPGSGALWQGAGFPGREVHCDDPGLSDLELSKLEWHLAHGQPPQEGSTPRAMTRRAEYPLPPAPTLSAVADRPRVAPRFGRAFRLEICIGGGAYICGEETALLESMEGRRPQPRHKPPYPTQSGLWGLPTLVNNVETFWWAQRLSTDEAGALGAPGSRRLYSLSGDVERPGVYEDVLGLTVRDLIEGHGGGVKGGAPVACFVPGGAATGLLPGSQLDIALEPEALKKAGTALGTAGVVVYAEPTDPAAIAAAVLRFFAQESCSQCTPCRLGCRAFADWMDGSEPPPDDSAWDHWLEAMELASICGLGFTAPLVVRQLQRWFGVAGVSR